MSKRAREEKRELKQEEEEEEEVTTLSKLMTTLQKFTLTGILSSSAMKCA